MIYELLIVLIILLWLSFMFNRKDILAPSFIFCISFVFSCIWAIIYAKEWELKLHFNTFLVISVGVLIFLLTSCLIKLFFDGIKGNNYIHQKTELKKIEIEKWKKIVCVIYCIFTILYTLNAIKNAVNGSWRNITDAINTYRTGNLFLNKNVALPSMVYYTRIIAATLAYWYIYVIINNYLIDKKVDFLSVVIILLCVISDITTGSRGDAINLILATIPISYLLLKKSRGFDKHIEFKTILKVIICGIIFLTIFQQTALLLGRSSKYDPMYYLAIYCGAQIKNLDTFLQENEKIIRTSHNSWGSQTFINAKKWLEPKISGEYKKYEFDLPFRKINGKSLGNVYTTFYPYIYDFGYTGLIVLVAIMSIIAQSVYEVSKRTNAELKPDIFIIIYSQMFSLLVLAFFSNKFYEEIFNRSFIYNIILLNAFNFIFCKIKIQNKKKDF